MPRHPDRPIHLTGEQARGGEIILRTPGRRAVFLAGLIGAALLAVVLGLAGIV